MHIHVTVHADTNCCVIAHHSSTVAVIAAHYFFCPMVAAVLMLAFHKSLCTGAGNKENDNSPEPGSELWRL